MSGRDRLLFDLERRGGERLRLVVSEFRGRPVIGLRNWWTDDAGVLRPGKSGVSIPAGAIPELCDALREAARLAESA